MKFVKVILLILSFLILISSLYAENEVIIEYPLNEYKLLSSFQNENNAHNANIYRRLSEISENPAYRLFYLRQGKALSPKEFSIHEIQNYRNLLGSNIKSLDKTPFWHYFVLKFYLPSYQIDIIFTVLLIFSILYFLFSSFNIIKYIIFLLIVIFTFQKYFIYEIYGDRFLISFNINYSLREGVIIADTIAYSAPTFNSQESLSLKKGSEVIIHSNLKEEVGSSVENWLHIESADRRRAWIKNNNNLLIIR